MFSEVRTTTGITITVSDIAPAMAEKCPMKQFDPSSAVQASCLLATTQLVDEQAGDDRRRAQQDVVDEADEGSRRAG